ncbi:MAG: sugar phosphate isomerase/epimerase [Gemmataceae bacterium]
MSAVTRRAFLTHGLAASVAALAAPRVAAIPPIERPGKPLFRLSLSAYSLRDHFSGRLQPAMTLDDYVDFAGRLELDAVEPTAYYFKDTSPAGLARLKARCTRLGLDISGGAVGNNFCHPDPAGLQAEIKSVKQWIERYALLGAKTVRIFAGTVAKGDSEEKARARCVAAIHECCDYAARYGVFLALENHGGITSTPDQLLALVQAVKHDCFAVNLDTGNFRTEDPYGDLARVATYAVTVQVKTEIQRANRPKEEADLGRIIAILRQANYRGYLALEYEAADPPLTAIPRYVATLRRLIATA